MRARAAAFALALASTVGCRDEPSPRDQWLLAFGTDAPVPNLADRLRVELIGPDGTTCGGCVQEFAANDPALFPISLGVQPAADLRVRARLYRADHLRSDGSPDPVTTIDILGSLSGAPSGITPVSLTIPMACIGAPADVTASTSCDPATGSVGPVGMLTEHSLPAPGSWPPSASAPCPGPAPDGMVCVDGGVFLMGDDRLPPLNGDASSATFPEHVVQLSPFAIDRDELTVGEFKKVKGANPNVKFVFGVKSEDVVSPDSACNYAMGDEVDNLPMNCVFHHSAELICSLQGKELMTEAQYEYAARNRAAHTKFPWGAADSPCLYAVVGVGPTGLEVALTSPGGNTDCRKQPDGSLGPWGTLSGGSPLDVTIDGVRNLAGNLSEWVRDDPVPYSDAFWSSAGLLDPVAKREGAGTMARGASFRDAPGDARAVLRQPLEDGSYYSIGVRCVKSMR